MFQAAHLILLGAITFDQSWGTVKNTKPPSNEDLVSEIFSNFTEKLDAETFTDLRLSEGNQLKISNQTEVALQELINTADKAHPLNINNTESLVVTKQPELITNQSESIKIHTQSDEIKTAPKPPYTTVKGITGYTTETLPLCPNGLTYYKNENSSFCYLITEPSEFPPTCPYPNNLLVEDANICNQTVWAFAKRNVSNGFGPFEWLNKEPPLKLHRQSFKKVKNITQKNCLVYNYTNQMFIPTNCSEKYPTLCAYRCTWFSGQNRLDHITSYDQYCKKRFNESCISNFFKYPPVCYCKSTTNNNNQLKNSFCEKLTEPTIPFESILLSQRLLKNNDRCWIGLINNMGSYQWSNLNKTTNYTYWSKQTDYTKTLAALTTDGWVLNEDGDLNCGVCEVKIEDHPQVHLKIKQLGNSNTLTVEVKNLFGIFQSITCLSQHSSSYSRKPVRYILSNNFTFQMKLASFTPGYYWCVALQIPDLIPIYSNTIFMSDIENIGHEYAISLNYPFYCDPYLDYSYVTACKNLTYNLSEVIHTSRTIKILKINMKENIIEVLCHCTTKNKQISITKESEELTKLLKKSNVDVNTVASIQVCLPSVTILGNQTLHWPETPMGVTTIPRELCVQIDGMPVVRTCDGNYYHGCRWLEVIGKCADAAYPERTHLLNQLAQSETSPISLVQNLQAITQDTTSYTGLDIHLVSKTLKRLASYSHPIALNDVATVFNSVMHFNPSTVKETQGMLNSTDMILSSLDEILAVAKTNESGYTSAATEKLLVQISNLNKTNITGIKLGISENSFESSRINPLQHDETATNKLTKEDFELALVIPPRLRDDIIKCTGNSSSNLITTVFYDDNLFSNLKNTSHHPDRRVISVSIPNFNCSFSAPLQIIFKTQSNGTDFKCAPWLYGQNEAKESIHGEWSIEGTATDLGNRYQMCEFSHVTHFSLLVLGASNEISAGHEKALDILTAIGSGLSILGLLGIFITAIAFKRFREANGIVINFSIAMTAQIILLFVADSVPGNTAVCTAFGAILHYIVLVQFLWMLTIAILQYKRYVLVFTSPTTHLVLKSCAVSWGIPLIPVITIISISRDNYGSNSYGLCYALGNYFIFGVLIPVSLILLINLVVFSRIMVSIILSRKMKSHQKKKVKSSLQLRLAIMLFFLLGLTWGFGLLAATGTGITYSYLFCLTATLQGFILFLYFIVLNKRTRLLWLKNFCCCKFEANDATTTTDSAGRTTGRRRRQSITSNTNSVRSDIRHGNRSSTDF